MCPGLSQMLMKEARLVLVAFSLLPVTQLLVFGAGDVAAVCLSAWQLQPRVESGLEHMLRIGEAQP